MEFDINQLKKIDYMHQNKLEVCLEFNAEDYVYKNNFSQKR